MSNALLPLPRTREHRNLRTVRPGLWLLPLALMPILAACSTTPEAEPTVADPDDTATESGHGATRPAWLEEGISTSEWLDAPPTFDTFVLPAGDPAARHLPDVLPSGFTPKPFYRLNPNPQRRYRITGRIPPHYDVEFGSDFGAYGIRDPACQKLIADADSRVQPFMQVQVPLSVRRLASDRYEATLVIDRMTDDPCQWVYQSTRIRVIDRNLRPDSDPVPFPNEGVISAHRYYLVESMPYCPPGTRRCTEEWARAIATIDDAPVLMRCRVFSARGHLKHPYVGCGDSQLAYKKKHLLRRDTGPITIDLYDIGIEPDPLTPPSAPEERHE